VSSNATWHGAQASGRGGSRHALLVLPHERRDGFWANIGGHLLDLADPNAGHAAAPTPDDLFIGSIASELAWSARGILRSSGLPDDVSVTAEWLRHEGPPPSVSDINLTVTVPRRADAVAAALATSFEKSLAARSLAKTSVHISLEE
jgi:uncharacterized OsmC-like protein